jgi:hypothetical protein
MMREPSRAGGGAFGAEFCAKTKTDNPTKTQSDKISVEQQRIAFLGGARQRLVSADLVARKKRCKLDSNCHQLGDSLWMILPALQLAEGREEKRPRKQS